jgi:hypothetical protein
MGEDKLKPLKTKKPGPKESGPTSSRRGGKAMKTVKIISVLTIGLFLLVVASGCAMTTPDNRPKQPTWTLQNPDPNLIQEGAELQVWRPTKTEAAELVEKAKSENDPFLASRYLSQALFGDPSLFERDDVKDLYKRLADVTNICIFCREGR